MSEFIFPEILNNSSLDISVHYLRLSSKKEFREIKLSQNLLSFIHLGQKRFQVNGAIKTVDSNSFLMFPSGRHYMSEIPSPRHGRFEAVLFFFSNKVVCEAIQNIHSFQQNSNVSELAYSYSKDAYITAFADSLRILCTSGKKPNRQLLISKLKEFIAYVHTTSDLSQILGLIQYQYKFNVIAPVLEKELLSGKNIKEIAIDCNMSPSTFRRKFLDHYEMSPGVWIKNKRLEHAANLLKTGQKHPGEIYTDCGYSSMSNFIRAFKQKFGLTPTELKLKYTV